MTKRKTSKMKHSGILIIGALLIMLSAGCGSAKYAVDFRKAKKQINTYLVIKPLVTLNFFNQQLNTIDTLLSDSTERIVGRIVMKTLSTKYKLKQINRPPYSLKSLDSIYSRIDNNKIKALKGISIATSLKANLQNSEDRYGLFVTIKGFYNPNYDPHYKLITGMATNSIIVAPKTKPRIELRVMVIDFLKNEVVFYDKSSTSNYDPRVESEVEQIVRLKLKNIYYK
jgi:hypothetical protein